MAPRCHGRGRAGLVTREKEVTMARLSLLYTVLNGLGFVVTIAILVAVLVLATGQARLLGGLGAGSLLASRLVPMLASFPTGRPYGFVVLQVAGGLLEIVGILLLAAGVIVASRGLRRPSKRVGGWNPPPGQLPPQDFRPPHPQQWG